MLDFIPHTKRRKMTKARAAKIFLARNGICFNCRRQIAQYGEPWFIEHPDAVAQGGSDDDADLWPSHVACKATKDAADAKSKAKRDRLVTASYAPDGVRQPSRLRSRGFDKAPAQHKATAELSDKFQNVRRRTI
jgi:hypothetical protein